MDVLRVAAAQYRLDRFGGLDAYEAKIVGWVAEAVGEGASLLVFPEYGALELCALAGARSGDATAAIETIDRLIPEVDGLHQMLARRHGVLVLAGSAPVRGGDGAVRNVARLFTPGGAVGRQEKLLPGASEMDDGAIGAGAPLSVFRTQLGSVGVALGRDIEFPLLVRAQVEAGADLILAPSYAETPHAAHRLRHAAAARAVENQRFVIRAATIGSAPWSPMRQEAVGVAGVLAPPDPVFGDDGVVVEGEPGRVGWVYADLDLEAMTDVREDGDGGNDADWREQGIVTGPVAEVVDLT